MAKSKKVNKAKTAKIAHKSHPGTNNNPVGSSPKAGDSGKST